MTNETGFGNIPFDETIRRYNLLLSEANKKIAAAAERVELLIAGLSLSVIEMILAVPSWVVPGTYLENLHFLESKKNIAAVELLFFYLQRCGERRT